MSLAMKFDYISSVRSNVLRFERHRSKGFISFDYDAAAQTK